MKNKSSFTRIFYSLIFFIIFVGSFYYIGYKYVKNPEAANIFIAVMKDRPTLDTENVVNDAEDYVKITVICNAHYNSVTIELTLYDENTNIISAHNLTELNYKKGVSYEIKYNFTVEEYLYVNSFKAKLISYQ